MKKTDARVLIIITGRILESDKSLSFQGTKCDQNQIGSIPVPAVDSKSTVEPIDIVAREMLLTLFLLSLTPCQSGLHASPEFA